MRWVIVIAGLACQLMACAGPGPDWAEIETTPYYADRHAPLTRIPAGRVIHRSLDDAAGSPAGLAPYPSLGDAG